MTDHVWRRLQLVVARGVANLIGHEKVQARVLADEILPNIDRVEPYGFSYRPHPGSQTYLLFKSGDRTRGIAIIIGDKQYNMQLLEGEVALHDDEGNYVHLKRGGNIDIKASSVISLIAPQITLDGQVTCTQSVIVNQGFSVLGGGGNGTAITGTLGITGSITCNGKDISDSHTHTGVLPGGGTTGPVT
jgi:phage baseplate assembly protein V